MKIKKLSSLILVSLLSVSCSSSNPFTEIIVNAITQLKSYNVEDAVKNIKTKSSHYEEIIDGKVSRSVEIEVDYQMGERYFKRDTDGLTTVIIENGEEYYLYRVANDFPSVFEIRTITKEKFEDDFSLSTIEHEFDVATSNAEFELYMIDGMSVDEIEEYYNNSYLEFPAGTEYTSSVHMEFESVDNGYDFKRTFTYQTSTRDIEFIKHNVLNEFGMTIYYYNDRIPYYDSKVVRTDVRSTIYNKTITKIQIEELIKE